MTLEATVLTRDQTRSRRIRPVRAHTVSSKKTTKRELTMLRERADLDLALAGDFFSPTTRGDCAKVARPCPHVSCKFNLYLDVNPKTGAVKFNFPDIEPEEMTHSCVLDVTDTGYQTLEQVAIIMNMTRERIRQVEVTAMAKVGPGLRQHVEDGESPVVETRGPLPGLDSAPGHTDVTDAFDVGFEAVSDRAPGPWVER